jgi:hypothetical protein
MKCRSKGEYCALNLLSLSKGDVRRLMNDQGLTALKIIYHPNRVLGTALVANNSIETCVTEQAQKMSTNESLACRLVNCCRNDV